MREIKVQLYRGEDDNYVELWKTVEKLKESIDITEDIHMEMKELGIQYVIHLATVS